MTQENQDNIDCTPSTMFLLAQSSQNISYRLAVAEWIDNALDAGATAIDIVYKPGKSGSFVSVTDNGDGAPDFTCFAKLGDHRSKGGIGMHGVGFKDACLKHGGARSSVEITTVHEGVLRNTTVDWGKMIDDNRWSFPRGSERPARTGERGTSLVVSPLEGLPQGKQWTKMLDDLGYLYSPAIKRGRTITVHRLGKGSEPVPLARWKLPVFEGDPIKAEISVEGKRASVCVGIVKQGVLNDRPGISYTYKNRVIQTASEKGCGNHSTTRIAGVVELLDEWRLNKNKDGIPNDQKLYEEVERAIEPVLKAADASAMRLESAAFLNEVENLVNTNLNPDTKAKRDKGDKRGTKLPTGRGGRHKRASKEQDGATFARKRFGSVSVEWYRHGTSDFMGRVNGSAVALNLDNPVVEQIKRDNNVLAAALAVTGIIADYSRNGAQCRLAFAIPDGEDQFSQIQGTLLSKPITADGKSLLSEAAE